MLNANFINVLVDREERPDLDGYYMEIMQAMNGSSGWPGNFVLTAYGVPLFALGYVTPESEYGSPGLLEVLQSLVNTWQENRAAILDDLDITRRQLRNLNEPDAQSLLREVYSRPLRGTVLSVIPPDAPLENKKWPLLAGRPLLSNKATAYVCRKRLCDLPVDTPAQLSIRLDKLVRPEPASAP